MKPFSATCRMYDPTVDRLRLTQEEYDVHKSSGALGRATFDYGTKMWNVEQRCDFATTDVTELRHHLETVHDNKKRSMERDPRSGKMVERQVRINSVLPQRPMHPKWRGPSLKAEGQPFDPTGLEPGAQVEWDGRSGQVWSLGHEPRSVWVVPDSPSVQDRTEDGIGVRHELAVLVVQRPDGRLLQSHTSWSSWKLEAA